METVCCTASDKAWCGLGIRLSNLRAGTSCLDTQSSILIGRIRDYVHYITDILSLNPFFSALIMRSRHRSLTSLPVEDTRALPSIVGAKQSTVSKLGICDELDSCDDGELPPLGNNFGDVMLLFLATSVDGE